MTPELLKRKLLLEMVGRIDANAKWLKIGLWSDHEAYCACVDLCDYLNDAICKILQDRKDNGAAICEPLNRKYRKAKK